MLRLVLGHHRKVNHNVDGALTSHTSSSSSEKSIDQPVWEIWIHYLIRSTRVAEGMSARFGNRDWVNDQLLELVGRRQIIWRWRQGKEGSEGGGGHEYWYGGRVRVLPGRTKETMVWYSIKLFCMGVPVSAIRRNVLTFIRYSAFALFAFFIFGAGWSGGWGLGHIRHPSYNTAQLS